MQSCALSLHSTYRGHRAYSCAFSLLVHIQTLDRQRLLATKAHGHYSISLAEASHYRYDYEDRASDRLCSINFSNLAHRDAFKNESDNAVWVSVTITTQPATIGPPLRYSSPSLFKGIAAVLDDPVGSDVAFVIKGKGRNKIVYAYSNILIARSQHFKDLLTGPWQESQLQALKTDSHVARDNNETEEVAKENDTPSSIATLLEDSDAEVDEQPSPRVRRSSNKSGSPPALKRQVAITGCSYITFRALIEYLMTDDVVLGPLLSEYMTDGCAQSFTLDPVQASDPDEGLLQSLRAAHAKRVDLVDPFHGVALRRCSPKSLYALADRYDLPELKERCLKKILASISEKNILWEILSPFTATYTAVLTAEAKLLREHWPKLPKSVIKTLHQ